MMFHVGQRVVCVGDFSHLAGEVWADTHCIAFPVQGQVYTVRKLVQRVVDGGESAYAIMLDEVINMPCLLDKKCEGGWFEIDDPRLTKPDEIAFDARDFRPLIVVEDFMSAGISASPKVAA